MRDRAAGVERAILIEGEGRGGDRGDGKRALKVGIARGSPLQFDLSAALKIVRRGGCASNDSQGAITRGESGRLDAESSDGCCGCPGSAGGSAAAKIILGDDGVGARAGAYHVRGSGGQSAGCGDGWGGAGAEDQDAVASREIHRAGYRERRGACGHAAGSETAGAKYKIGSDVSTELRDVVARVGPLSVKVGGDNLRSGEGVGDVG